MKCLLAHHLYSIGNNQITSEFYIGKSTRSYFFHTFTYRQSTIKSTSTKCRAPNKGSRIRNNKISLDIETGKSTGFYASQIFRKG